jgi:hypothetical protein
MMRDHETGSGLVCENLVVNRKRAVRAGRSHRVIIGGRQKQVALRPTSEQILKNTFTFAWLSGGVESICFVLKLRRGQCTLLH